MARILNKLTDRTLRSELNVGHHSDGGGLYIRVKKSGAKSWAFRWKQNGKVREIGLGGYPSVSIAVARQLAEEHRSALARGETPQSTRRSEQTHSFSEVAEQFLDFMESQWSNAKHRQQWRNTLNQYCGRIANKSVAEIDLHDVLSVLKPIWNEKPETASRVRGRIEKVLSYALTKGMRQDANPAIWKGNLDNVLPKPQKLSRGHHKALPYQDLPNFMESLGAADGIASRALELLILTGCRTSEVIDARWEEIDLEAEIWAIPAERMKMRREHRVPLTDKAKQILLQMQDFRTSEFIFPGLKPNKPLSNMAMAVVLKRMKVTNATVHGFRSTFRDWAGDKTNAPREVIEQCLAHVIGNLSEQAYRRSDALEKRRVLLNQWEDYCYGQSNVVALRA